MTHEEVKDLILKEKLMILYRGVPVEKMGEAAKALVKAGIKLLEITFDQTADDPAALFRSSVSEVRKAVGDALCIGAGTVMTEQQVITAYEAGAEYIISPCTKESVVKMTRKLGLVSIPAAMTPTEIVNAWELGADIVKLFPADDMGFHYMWNLRGPLGYIPLMCTGGVNPETIPQFFANGAAAVGTGVTVLDRKLLGENDFDGIQKLAEKHVAAVKSCT